jgi:SAM-dependent methyltransferase
MRLTPELHRLAPDVPGDVFTDEFPAACERLDRFIGALVLELAATLDLAGRTLPDVAELCETRGWSRDADAALLWLFETLELYGHAVRNAAGWEVSDTPLPCSSSELRDEAVRLVPASGPAFRILDLCAQALPAVLRGEIRGEDALFGPSTLGLWFEYFSNENPHYAPNNTLTAVALSRAVGPRARVMEVGGGGGSAALAAFARLAAEGRTPSSYLFTEVHPAFLRRGTRSAQAAVPAGCAFESRRYDVNLSPDEQGMSGRNFDAIVAVNTLHLADDVVLALRRLRSLLAPHGAIVLGELVRPDRTAGVHLELPFCLLEAYRRPPSEGEIRPRPGFLAWDGWRKALAVAGYAEVALLPADLDRCVEAYPGFYCAAITARA